MLGLPVSLANVRWPCSAEGAAVDHTDLGNAEDLPESRECSAGLQTMAALCKGSSVIQHSRP